MNMNDAFLGSLIFNKDSGGGGGGDTECVTFTVEASHPANPSTYDIVVKVGNTVVFSKNYPCTTLGVFDKTTDTFTYNEKTFTFTAQGFAAYDFAVRLFITINNRPHEVWIFQSYSATACDDIFDMHVTTKGEVEIDKIIDWTLFSHPNAFDPISMPASYSNYEHIAIAIIQNNINQDFMEYMLRAYIKERLELGIDTNACKVFDTVNILASPPGNYDFPMMSGYEFSSNNANATMKMNTTQILGTSYPWGWQNLYLACFGFNG